VEKVELPKPLVERVADALKPKAAEVAPMDVLVCDLPIDDLKQLMRFERPLGSVSWDDSIRMEEGVFDILAHFDHTVWFEVVQQMLAYIWAREVLALDITESATDLGRVTLECFMHYTSGQKHDIGMLTKTIESASERSSRRYSVLQALVELTGKGMPTAKHVGEWVSKYRVLVGDGNCALINVVYLGTAKPVGGEHVRLDPTIEEIGWRGLTAYREAGHRVPNVYEVVNDARVHTLFILGSTGTFGTVTEVDNEDFSVQWCDQRGEFIISSKVPLLEGTKLLYLWMRYMVGMEYDPGHFQGHDTPECWNWCSEQQVELYKKLGHMYFYAGVRTVSYVNCEQDYVLVEAMYESMGCEMVVVPDDVKSRMDTRVRANLVGQGRAAAESEKYQRKNASAATYKKSHRKKVIRTYMSLCGALSDPIDSNILAWKIGDLPCMLTPAQVSVVMAAGALDNTGETYAILDSVAVNLKPEGESEVYECIVTVAMPEDSMLSAGVCGLFN
jgi:hypothetical protein